MLATGDSLTRTCPVLAPFTLVLHRSCRATQTPVCGSAVSLLWSLLSPDAGSRTSVPLPLKEHQQSTFVSQILERLNWRLQAGADRAPSLRTPQHPQCSSDTCWLCDLEHINLQSCFHFNLQFTIMLSFSRHLLSTYSE